MNGLNERHIVFMCTEENLSSRFLKYETVDHEKKKKLLKSGRN